ncbi:MAG: argininosuccinate lyase [Candidatus Latescibacterota bacterium]
MAEEPKKAMWGGRFTEGADAFLVEFGASIDVDIELLDVDVEGSKAWAEALGAAGILTPDEVKKIVDGLDAVCGEIKADRERPGFRLDRSLEDVHMTVESRLTARIGDAGAKLHTGRSRNDQVALDERLWLLRALRGLMRSLSMVQSTVLERAREHADHFAPSYTHLQQAQPVRLGHYLLAWFWMLERDRERFADAMKRADKCPLGSGAVAGTGFPVDREAIARRLGFSGVTENSIDATSDRDYIVETLSAAAMCMMHLSRICEDLIIWSSAEFGFARLPDRYSTGSSMMPQKKNPDSLELVRGKTGRVYGNLMALLTVMKGLPFSYGKDMQEDKEPLFDSAATLGACLRILDGVIRGVRFDTERLESSVNDFVYATDIADYLTLKGMPFRQAHEMAGRLVKWAVENGKPFSEIPYEVFRGHSGLFGEDVAAQFNLRHSADRRNITGGTGRDALLKQIARAGEVLAQGEESN